MDLGYIKPSKIFYHPDRIAAYIKGEEIQPISLKLYLTEKCNLSCKYCVYKSRISNKEMPLSVAYQTINRIQELGVKSIVLTGGEPTLYEDFDRVTKYVRQKNLELGLITNGVQPQSIEDFVWVRFSVDTINQETYRRIKGHDHLADVKDTINEAIQEKKTKSLQTTLGVQMVVTEENYREILEFIEYFSDFKLDYCLIRPVENAWYKPEELKCIEEQLDIAAKTKHNIPVMINQGKWNEIRNNYKKSYDGCPGAKFIGAVGVTGDFYICCTWMKEPKAKYGNLTDRRILEKRDPVLKKFNYNKCPVGCQGSLINKALTDFNQAQHRNFI